MTRIYFIVGLLFLIVVGWIKKRRQLEGLHTRSEFCKCYKSNLATYIKSRGQDGDAYGSLTFDSVKMQQELGPLGVLRNYKPPGVNFMLGNTAAILNMLPELQRRFNDPMVDISRHANDVAIDLANTLEEILIRHLGVLDSDEKTIARVLHNPFRLFQVGVQSVLLFPAYLITWLGLVQADQVDGVARHILFRILSGIVGVFGLVSSIVGIIVDWHSFIQIVSSIFKSIS